MSVAADTRPTIVIPAKAGIPPFFGRRKEASPPALAGVTNKAKRR
jgi:hypothetical protein